MKIALSLVSFLAAATTSASSVVEALKNEPASLFDLGMYRLSQSIESSHETVRYLFTENARSKPLSSWVSASYHADTDMIRVSAGIMDENATLEEMEAGCRSILRNWRIQVSKTMWRFFAHYGDERDPAVPIADLTNQVTLRCYIAGNGTSDGRFWASMPLRGDLDTDEGFTIGKWKMDNE